MKIIAIVASDEATLDAFEAVAKNANSKTKIVRETISSLSQVNEIYDAQHKGQKASKKQGSAPVQERDIHYVGISADARRASR